MAQNEPQRNETPPGPSPNSPSLLFEYQCRSGKFIRLANRIESKLFLPELECSIKWTLRSLSGQMAVIAYRGRHLAADTLYARQTDHAEALAC